jgi:hypothetical protein
MWVSAGVLEALQASFERTLTILREENSTLRRMLEQATKRADDLAGELARSFVLGAFGPDTRRPTITAPVRTSRDAVPGLGNVFDPVALGDPRGTFATEDEASLLFPSTNGNVEEGEVA